MSSASEKQGQQRRHWRRAGEVNGLVAAAGSNRMGHTFSPPGSLSRRLLLAHRQELSKFMITGIN